MLDVRNLTNYNIIGGNDMTIISQAGREGEFDLYIGSATHFPSSINMCSIYCGKVLPRRASTYLTTLSPIFDWPTC